MFSPSVSSFFPAVYFLTSISFALYLFPRLHLFPISIFFPLSSLYPSPPPSLSLLLSFSFLFPFASLSHLHLLCIFVFPTSLFTPSFLSLSPSQSSFLPSFILPFLSRSPCSCHLSNTSLPPPWHLVFNSHFPPTKHNVCYSDLPRWIGKHSWI